MTSQAEDVLYLSLTDTDALETLVTVGLPMHAIPEETMRPVVSWAIEQYFISGRTRAPSRQALLDTWGQTIDDARVELLPEDEDADTIDWAIDYLTSQWTHYQFQDWAKSAVTRMAGADLHDRVPTLSKIADEIFGLSMSVQPRHMRVEAAEGLERALQNYEARAREGHKTKGIIFGPGLEAVDEHTYGIHPGEVAVVAAGPKTGKSFMLIKVAKETWWTQEKTPVLFTLENSVEMTVDRLACMHLGIDARRWQRGKATEAEIEKVRWFINDELRSKDRPPFHIIHPEPGKRTMSAMVREAQMLGADGIFIDQLTFVEHPEPGRKARHEIIRDQMHDLKTLVSSSKQPVAAMIAHQVNRTGMEAARKAGFLLMEHMAEGSEVERTADWVFTMYQSSDARIAGEALLQIAAARREDTNAWNIVWQPSNGMAAVISETEVLQ